MPYGQLFPFLLLSIDIKALTGYKANSISTFSRCSSPASSPLASVGSATGLRAGY
jgi:hypothetical protein